MSANNFKNIKPCSKLLLHFLFSDLITTLVKFTYKSKMFSAFKIRQNTRQWSLLIFIFVGLTYLAIKFMHSNKSLSFIGNHGLCDACAKQYEAGSIVAVPISQIMSGKPIVLSQDDQRIVNYIWSNNHMHPPSDEEYNLKEPKIDPSRGQSQYIRKILKNMVCKAHDMTNGFFVECGALDGETRSNTLFMEKNLGWKGLLVEGDPSNFALMKDKHRKAWMANTCLAIMSYPHTANFLQKFNTGKVIGTDEATETDNKKYVKVQCMPLFSLLTAINVTTVDYFSLDVEGNELQVLKTIPFDKVYIRTLSVEYIHTTEGKMETINFMKFHGYRMVGEVHYPNNLANDLIFVHKDVQTDD